MKSYPLACPSFYRVFVTILSGWPCGSNPKGGAKLTKCVQCAKKTSLMEEREGEGQTEWACGRERQSKYMSLSAKLSENFPYSQHYPHLGAFWLISAADSRVRVGVGMGAWRRCRRCQTLGVLWHKFDIENIERAKTLGNCLCGLFIPIKCFLPEAFFVYMQ